MSDGRLPKVFPFVITLCIIALLFPTSCGKAPPMAPQAFSPQSQIDIVGLNLPEGLSLQSGLSVTKLIKSKGGKVEIPGFLKLDFPKNALSQETYITITIPETDEFIWELEPDGTVFNKEIKLTVYLEYAEDVDSEDIDIFWDDDGSWIGLNATYDKKHDAYKINLGHFSRYALATE
ncbi:MAG: hypothetical protein ACE5OP_02910 [Candidatus Glassbacteria bacterium]